MEIADAVALANANETFAGLSAAAAAERALQNAEESPVVTDAVMQNFSGILCEDTVWRAAASPFVVVQSIIVGGSICGAGNENVTLTIEPGVEVRFRRFLSLQVRSELVASGEEDAKIVFTSDERFPAVGDWSGIRFEDTSVDAELTADGSYMRGSIIEHARVEYATGGFQKGVVTLTSAALLKDDELTNNEDRSNFGILSLENSTGVRLQGLRVLANSGRGITTRVPSGGVVDIVDSVVADNSQEGLYVFNNGRHLINNSRFEGTSTGISTSSEETLIEESTIAGNRNSGVVAYGVTHITVSIIRDNIASGIGIGGSGFQISDSLIVGNGNGVVGGTGAECNIARNCFTGNGPAGAGEAMHLSGCTVTENTVVGDRVRFDTQSQITQNNLLGAPTALEAPAGISPPDYIASGNWWGTMLDSIIRQRSFDFSDDSSRISVIFQPIAPAPIPGAPDIDLCREGNL